MIFIDQMKDLKIYKRPMYLPTVDGDKKNGSAVLLLTPDYDSSRGMITNPLLINKMRFQSYYMDPNVSYYINGKVAKGKEAEDYIQEMSVLDTYHNLVEMSTDERNALPDSKFGLPSKRKYPLDTADHVKSAIKFFNYVDKEDEEELAKNIEKAMGDFFDTGEMPRIGKNNRLSNYITEETRTQKVGKALAKSKILKAAVKQAHKSKILQLSIKAGQKQVLDSLPGMINGPSGWYFGDKAGISTLPAGKTIYLGSVKNAVEKAKDRGDLKVGKIVYLYGVHPGNNAKSLVKTIEYENGNDGKGMISSNTVKFSSSIKILYRGKIEITDKSFAFIEDNKKEYISVVNKKLGINEAAITRFTEKNYNSYQGAKSVYDKLSSEEQRFVCPNGRFVDSPYLAYRRVLAIYDEENGNQILPIAFAELYMFDPDSRTAELIIAVIPEQRRNHAALQLLGEAYDVCERSGDVDFLKIRVSVKNKAMETMLRKKIRTNSPDFVSCKIVKGGYLEYTLRTYSKLYPAAESNLIESSYSEVATDDKDEDLVRNPAIEEIFGYKSKDGLYNAIVRLVDDDKNLYRGRSEMIVLSKDHSKIYLDKNDRDDAKYPYRLPGGSWDENEDHMFCAIRETREEARLETTNVKGFGSYAYIGDVKDWVKKNIPEEYQWKGYYTEVFVGEFNGSYMGKVDKEDQDKNMAERGKFYPIGLVLDKLSGPQRDAVNAYLKEANEPHNKGIKMSHIIASGIIRDKDGKMLLEWHNKANGLVLPSGKANTGEDPYQALKRELYEELGIFVKEATLNKKSSYQAEYPVGSDNWVIFEEYNYIIHSYDGIIENKEPDKHKDLVWMNENEIITEAVDMTAELQNHIDIYLGGLRDPDDVLYNALAQYIWYSGSRARVSFLRNIITPNVYYDIINDIKLPIKSVRDIPVLSLEVVDYYKDYDGMYKSDITDEGYTIIKVYLSPFRQGSMEINTYIKSVLRAIYIAILRSMHEYVSNTRMANILADWLSGATSKYNEWGSFLFSSDGYRDDTAIQNFVNAMYTGEPVNIYEELANEFGISENEFMIQEDDYTIQTVFNNRCWSWTDLSEIIRCTGTVSEIYTTENSFFLNEAALDKDSYIRIGDTITIFEASTQDTKLRELLYKERIKQRGQLIPLLNRAKEDIPDIKYAYPDIDKYKQKNIFVDLYYYNELFFRNNTWDKDRGYKLYLELLKRLLNNPTIIKAGYNKRTVFIPVLDWNLDRSPRMWMYKETINPISIIFNMLRLYPDDLKETFGKMDVIFFGRDKYFKINFSNLENPKQVAMKFSTFIKKLWVGEEFDPEDEDTSMDNGSSRQLKADLVDTIEDKKGVDLTKNVSKVEKERESDEEDTSEEVVKDGKQQQKEDDMEYIARRIEDVRDAEDIDDALEQLSDDEEFKEILASLTGNEDNVVKIDANRAARMSKLDQEFLKSNVGGRTVSSILNDKEANHPLEKTSYDIASPNEEWKEMTYINFDKDYDLDRDIVACFYHFTKVSKPVSIRSLKTVDNSTSEDSLMLYTCEMEDFKGTRFTIKLDIPIMEGNRLRLRGNDKFIQNQLFNMPIIKTEVDTCQIVTNYQKIFIRTYNTVTGRSLPDAGKLIKAIKKYEGNKIKITLGDNSKVCDKYEVPNDYKDIAGVVSKIETPEFIFYLNQDEIRAEVSGVDESKGLPLGIRKKDKSVFYFVMENTMTVARTLRTFMEGADPKFKQLIDEAKPSTSGVYSQCSILNSKIPLVVICAYLEGLTTVLKKANVDYRLMEKMSPEIRAEVKDGYKSAIRFEDGYLVYATSYTACMLLNGLDAGGCERFSMMDIDNKNMYMEILDMFNASRYTPDGLENFYDCLVDPITLETLEYYHLPTDFVGILLYANVLLCDNKFIKHGDMSSRRVRRTEQIAAYTYEALSEAYAIYANMIKHSRTKPTMSLKQSVVIDKILSSPISGDDSIINALEAAETTNSFTFRGKAGMNEQRSYTLDKRIYDNSMLNVLGMSTAYSSNVSITRQSTINMSVDTSRGYIKPIDGNTKEMNAANTLAATEAMIPFGSTRDDAPRTLMSYAQTAQHQVITEESDPLLVTSGADEMLPYITSDKFAYKAKDNGKITELTDTYMIVEYKSGKKEYIDLTESIEKNSNGGYYTMIKLDVAEKLKVGSTIKKNQIIAYDRKSFSNSVGESDNLAYNVGKLCKVAIGNFDDCFEDSGLISQHAAEKLATKVIDKEAHVLDKDSNVFKIIKIGDHVEPEDALLIWQNPHDEEEANTLLRLMGNDQEMVTELGRRTVKSEISGKVAGIKIDRTVEIDELSPSLQKIVKEYEAPIKKQKKLMESQGINANRLPATYKLQPTGKLKKAQDAVLIEFYLERIDIISVGDKTTHYSANKAIIKNITPPELTPYTDFRPEEPIDALIGQTSIDKRMVTSTMNYGALQKLLIETDRSIKDILGIKYDPSQV